MKLSVDQIQAQVKENIKTIQFLERELPEDPVVLAFKENVDAWRQNIPTLLDLANPALKTRHWEKIFYHILKYLLLHLPAPPRETFAVPIHRVCPLPIGLPIRVYPSEDRETKGSPCVYLYFLASLSISRSV